MPGIEGTHAVNTALLVVDVQVNMFKGPWCIPTADELAGKIQNRVDAARAANQLVVWVQNDGPEGDVDEPFSEGWDLLLQPHNGEWVVRKTTQNVFESNPDLADRLRAAGAQQVELVGVQSELCLSASARGAKACGFAVKVPQGLHATFDDGFPSDDPNRVPLKSADEISAEVQAALAAEGISS